LETSASENAKSDFKVIYAISEDEIMDVISNIKAIALKDFMVAYFEYLHESVSSVIAEKI
jgi:hypothetical protein